MRARKVLLPEGVQDILIDDCIYRRQIERKIMKNFAESGYMEVSSPGLEYYDLFSRDYLASNGDKMFKLIDTNGSILVLRPDCTVPIVRMVSTKMKDFIYPLKLCYLADVFRIDEEQAGKKREFRQAGVELFGIGSYRADAEVIITAIESLKNLALENFQIDIGQTKLLKAVLDRAGIGGEERETLVYYIENKKFIELNELIEELAVQEDIKTILGVLPRIFGKPQEVLAEVKKLPLTGDMLKALGELEEVCNRIREYGLGEYISLDLGLVTSLKYYSGVIFKGFTRDLGVVLLSGGRYDRLLMDFDMTCPAIGFAFAVNRITKALKIQENLKLDEKKHILILEGAGARVNNRQVQELRDKGYIVELSLIDREDAEGLRQYIGRRRVDQLMEVDGEGRLRLVENLGGV